MAIWSRRRDGIDDLTGLVHHTHAGSRHHTSFALTQRLIDEGVGPSVGSVGDAYQNALAEFQIGSYKAELIRPRRTLARRQRRRARELRVGRLVQHRATPQSIDDLAKKFTTLHETVLLPTG